MGEMLKIEGLSIYYCSKEKKILALDGLNLTMQEGRILAIVGESGCGKTTLAMSIARLLTDNAHIRNGKIIFKGENILDLSLRQLENIRGRQIAYIFQDPTAALNPVISIGQQLRETIESSQRLGRKDATEEAIRLLAMVSIPDPGEHLKFYAHQLSGGMNQRVMIALALASRPQLLIADEPTSNLDVTIEASILQLILRLKAELGLSVIFITHDLSLVKFLADEIAVMYQGKIVELQETEKLFTSPQASYTRELLGAARASN